MLVQSFERHVLSAISLWKFFVTKFLNSFVQLNFFLPNRSHAITAPPCEPCLTMPVARRFQLKVSMCARGLFFHFDSVHFHDTSKKFHTMEVSKRLDVDFQQISIPWKYPKGWKLTSNKFPYHGMEVSKRLEVDFQQISIPLKCPKGWKFVGSRNDFHDLERTRFFQRNW